MCLFQRCGKVLRSVKFIGDYEGHKCSIHLHSVTLQDAGKGHFYFDGFVVAWSKNMFPSRLCKNYLRLIGCDKDFLSSSVLTKFDQMYLTVRGNLPNLTCNICYSTSGSIGQLLDPRPIFSYEQKTAFVAVLTQTFLTESFLSLYNFLP